MRRCEDPPALLGTVPAADQLKQLDVNRRTRAQFIVKEVTFQTPAMGRKHRTVLTKIQFHFLLVLIPDVSLVISSPTGAWFFCLRAGLIDFTCLCFCLCSNSAFALLLSSISSSRTYYFCARVKCLISPLLFSSALFVQQAKVKIA